MSDVESLRIQQDEFKILSYIYLQEFTSIKQSPPFKFNILCRPFILSQQFEYQISLLFELPKNYPRVPPKYEIEPITGITRDSLQQITNRVEDILFENRDKPVVYQVIEEIRLWIHNYLIEGKAKEEDYENYRKKKVDEVFERPKFSAFTPVTVENFLAWKKKFEDEHRVKTGQKKQSEPKITGKEWFLGKEGDIEEDSDQESDEGDEEDNSLDERPIETEYTENRLFVMDE